MARDLAVRIEVDDRAASATLAKVERSLQGVENQAKSADAAVKPFERTLQQVSGSGQSVAAGVTDLRDRLRQMGDQASTLQTKLAGMRGELDTSSTGVSRLTGLLKTGAGILGAFFTVDAIRAWGKAVLDDADALTKMADKTGLSTDALQRLRAIGDDAGNSLEEITSAISLMQNRLAEGDSSAIGALDRLGLSLADLKQLDPEQQFYAIARAIQTVPDPMERTRDAMDLFGRTGAQVLPTLRADIEGITDGMVTMSVESIAALDKAGDAIGQFWRETKAITGEGAGLVVRAIDFLIGRYKMLQALAGVTSPEAPNIPSPGLPINRPLAVPGLPPKEILEASDKAADKLLKTVERLIDKNERQRKETEQRILAEVRAAESTSQLSFKTLDLGKALDSIGGTRFVPTIKDISETSLRSATDVDALRGSTDNLLRSGRVATVEMAKLNTQIATLPNVTGRSFTEAKEAGQSFADFLRNDLGRVILGAFQGGGNIARSIGGAIGGFFTSSSSGIGQLLSGGLTKMLGSTIGGALGSVLPGIGTVLGSLGGSLFGKLFKNPEKEINPVREAFVQAAGGLDVLNRKAHDAGVTLTALLDARNPKEYERAIHDLTQALDFQSQSMEFLQQTIQKYGFSIEELGPALQRQRLDEQAQQLFKEFQALTTAGIDMDTVLQKMGSNVQAFVTEALKTGTEVPAALAPMIQRMQELGLLVDANGNVITNLEEAGVKFSLTMSEGFRSLIDEVRKLTDAIARGLGGALSSVSRQASDLQLGVVPTQDVPVVPMAAGGMGRVLRPTLFYSKGNEDFAFSGEGRGFGGKGGGGGTVVLELDGRALAEVQLPYLPDAVKRYKLSR